jgi:hypothetical protein
MRPERRTTILKTNGGVKRTAAAIFSDFCEIPKSDLTAEAGDVLSEVKLKKQQKC